MAIPPAFPVAFGAVFSQSGTLASDTLPDYRQSRHLGYPEGLGRSLIEELRSRTQS